MPAAVSVDTSPSANLSTSGVPASGLRSFCCLLGRPSRVIVNETLDVADLRHLGEGVASESAASAEPA